MSDAWNEIQAIKSKRNNLREKLEKRKRERQDILSEATTTTLGTGGSASTATSGVALDGKSTTSSVCLTDADPDVERLLLQLLADQALALPITSRQLFQRINSLRFKPVTHGALNYYLEKLAAQSYVSMQPAEAESDAAAMTAITATPPPPSMPHYVVTMVEHGRVQSLYEQNEADAADRVGIESGEAKRKFDDEASNESSSAKFSRSSAANSASGGGGGAHSTLHHLSKDSSSNNTSDIIALLAMPSTREKQIKLVGEEILELLSKPTAKERSLAEKFKSQGGAQVMEFCPHGTRTECVRVREHAAAAACRKLHFRKIIQAHTDETLGDCSFLNTCFHMDSCKYVHYKVDASSPAAATPTTTTTTASSHPDGQVAKAANAPAATDADDDSPAPPATVTDVAAADTADDTVAAAAAATASRLEGGRALRAMALAKIKQRDPSTTLHPPQWIQCDLRYLDMTVLGKFAVIMADPPWDIHMELPYGTMSDDEMRQLGVPALQDDGLIFLWVTGRAMELGRECLKLWGYERFDELIWVKTNQLQRIIRTGRTGHWLNHGKEHCLVGTKGRPQNLNRGLDCDVIVAEVRATSHKPDEIYGIIERLSPGTRKIELFGRPHNVQPNWITLGNQLDGIRLVDPNFISQFQQRYPDGNCMAPINKS